MVCIPQLTIRRTIKYQNETPFGSPHGLWAIEQQEVVWAVIGDDQETHKR